MSILALDIADDSGTQCGQLASREERADVGGGDAAGESSHDWQELTISIA